MELRSSIDTLVKTAEAGNGQSLKKALEDCSVEQIIELLNAIAKNNQSSRAVHAKAAVLKADVIKQPEIMTWRLLSRNHDSWVFTPLYEYSLNIRTGEHWTDCDNLAEGGKNDFVYLQPLGGCPPVCT